MTAPANLRRFSETRRRSIIAAAVLAVAPSRALGAARLHRIGFVADFGGRPPEMWTSGFARRGLQEGKNTEFLLLQPFHGNPGRYRDHLRDLIARRPDVLVTGSTLHTRAAQRATDVVPIVFFNVADPLTAGFVQSLARPGGNVTGVSVHNLTLFPKRLELIRELMPAATRIALIIDGSFVRDGFPPAFYEGMRQTARSFDFALIEVDVEHMPGGIEEAFQNAVAKRADIVLPLGPWPSLKQPPSSPTSTVPPLNFGWRDGQSRYGIPVLGFQPALGGPQEDLLAQYGASTAEMIDLTVGIVALVLEGMPPRDIPVRQATKVDLVFNLKAARALGVTVPTQLLKRADRVIE